ncbi:hypothetical protein [Actinophytocola sp. KF-1]
MVLIKSDRGWVPAVLTSFESESALQELLHQDPSLIPGCEGAAMVRELSIPGVGSADLVSVDSEGVVTLVECKLKANPQIRREIIGQIIAYASGLAGTSYRQFDIAFTNRSGTPLLESVEAATGAEIDAESFRAAVATRLSTGAFRLVVAVDQITDELRQSVEYLNQHLSDSVLVMALEMGYLKHNGVEVLVPQTYGAELESLKRHSPTAPKRRWTTDDIATAIALIPEQDQRVALAHLLKHADDNAAKFKGGTGANPSAGYYYLVAGARRSMWSLYLKPQGATIAINLGSIANTSPALAQAMADTLRTAPVFADRLAGHDTVIGKYPEVSIASLIRDPHATTALYEAFDLALKAAPDLGMNPSIVD